jgi:aminoglycoside phosphotransferase (APT) family kinase protein
VGQLQPELAESARRLASGWAEVARTLPDVRAAPIHKDFHAGHVLLGESTWVIDLDEARQGDPAFDVAHFSGYLDVAFEQPHSGRLADLFVREYAAETGWRDPGTFEPHLAYTWLKIAKQWAVGTGPGRDASLAERASGAALALGRGWQCLGRSSTSSAAGRDCRRPSS